MANVSQIINAVSAVVQNPQEAMAMLYACGAESNCESIQNLAGAPAYGPWQIYLPYHPDVTAAQANDPTFAAKYMYTNRNVGGCTSQQGQLWSTNPQQAAFAAARCIEGGTPAEPYSATQQQQGAYWMAQLTTPQASVGTNGSVPVLSGINDFICKTNPALCAGIGVAKGVANGEGPLQLVRDFFSQDMIIRILLVFGGFGIVMMGIGSLLHVEQAAPIVAAAAA